METFEVTLEHIKLIKQMNVGWDRCEFGAPAIDPKRPYGNGDVLSDMMEILGEDPQGVDDYGDPTYSDAQAGYYMQLHTSTQTALQIVLCTGSFEPGKYTQMRPYHRLSWEKT